MRRASSDVKDQLHGAALFGQEGIAAVHAEDKPHVADLPGEPGGDAVGGQDGIGPAGADHANEFSRLLQAAHHAEYPGVVHGKDHRLAIVRKM